MENVIILASNNKNKLKEIKEKLNPFGIDVISQKEAGYDIEVEETGTTFVENATLKAETIFKVSQNPVIADDSGLEVDALNGEPGVYSARYAGENATDEDRINKILNLMKDITDDTKRTARFKCAICYIDSNGSKHIFEKVCEGMIAKEVHGNNGFGYDPIFMVGEKSFAELSSEDKNKISHRGKAVKELVDYLKNVK
ncbi:MAG: XTP/dITP diphosphatase [Clostridia bacterium]|nr:XTP/dITP diphosphatase [Clostridia bacterium]